MTNASGKILIVIGAVIIVTGLVLLILPKNLMPGRLPGDIYIKGRSYTFSFPIVTCIILSLLLSLVMYFINHFKK